MVFDDLQQKLVDRLNWDAFFSAPIKGVRALAENRMNLQTELDTALSKLGLAVVVAITRVSAAEIGALAGGVAVTVTLQVHEVPLINRASSGTQKTASQVLVKALSLWGRPWTPDRDVWSQMEFAGFSLANVDEEYGLITWTIEFQIFTMLETVVHVLATEGDRPLVTENEEMLLVSPTPA